MSESDSFTRKDFAVLSGVALLLVALLMLTFTPQAVYRLSKRSGYTRTEVEVLSPDSRRRSATVRVLSTGEELSVHRTSFDGSPQHARLPVWYNPDARLVLGLTLFDERIISAERHPELPGGGEVLGESVVQLAAGIGGLRLLTSRERATRKATPKRRKRRR
jgi:hypothetical protein